MVFRAGIVACLLGLGDAVNVRVGSSVGHADFLGTSVAALLAKGKECSCTFQNTCSCQGSVAFMQCIADACASNRCDCDNFHFTNACQQMSSLCPSTGLQCMEGNATCLSHSKGAQLSAAWERREVLHKKLTIKAKAAKGVVDADFFPVPTASKCVVIVCIQYMLVFTALALIRTYAEFGGGGLINLELALRAATQTLTYGPMLCVLFIAARMRVEFLSDGKDQPQMWVQNCMYATVFALMATTCLVLIIPLLTGQPVAVKPGSGDLEKFEGPGHLVLGLTVMRYVIQLAMYGGVAGIMSGIQTYTPPGVTDWTTLPPPAPAVACTMILADVFFFIQLVIAGARSYTEFTGKVTTRLCGVMNTAAETISSAPMLAIVFLAARMRALQHNSQPQSWAQDCMYSATFSLVVTVILAIAVPLVLKGEMTVDPATGQPKYTMQNRTLGLVLIAARYLCMAGMYVGVIGVIYSIIGFQAPAGMKTLPVSPTVQCVINLCVQYFLIYSALNVMVTMVELTGGAVRLEEYRMFAALEASKATVAFAPMLSILFVTTRMYALLLTDKKGAPQAWVQDGMYMATWSLMISFLMCLATGAVSNSIQTDSDGNIVNKFANRNVAIAFTAVRYFTMVLLYGGIITVVVGLFVMTPETANGRGSVPLVSDVVDKTPMGNPPPGVSDAPVQFLHMAAH
eukprot:TRINITY_DN338_c0_g4_i2.p1 TRINITY_DN338_c0_g4~~TRINITY_DN338_c0_g4_i2.p1  ORF type:complete len:684 (-),score=133.15 TRINITY_DN338_c0_g4_i2:128-2179(-)